MFSNLKKDDMVIIDNYIYSFSCDLPNGVPIKPYYSSNDDCELEFIADVFEKKIDQYDSLRELIKHEFGLKKFYYHLDEM